MKNGGSNFKSLEIREYYAGLALQGLIIALRSSMQHGQSASDLAKEARVFADALVSEMMKEVSDGSGSR